FEGADGGNSLSRMREIGIKGGELIAINTDAQDLLYANADQKILIGRELTQGLGAGSNPKIGEEAAKESGSEIKKKIAGSDMVFITCGLGGGTGTGAAPVIASLAKKHGALTIGVVTLPFTIVQNKLGNKINKLCRKQIQKNPESYGIYFYNPWILFNGYYALSIWKNCLALYFQPEYCKSNQGSPYNAPNTLSSTGI
ncbi:unnamed protein product, partial [marine sediment metagenome]